MFLVHQHLSRIPTVKMAESFIFLTFLLLLAPPGGLPLRGGFHHNFFGNGNNRQTTQPVSESASQFANLISEDDPSNEVGSR